MRGAAEVIAGEETRRSVTWIRDRTNIGLSASLEGTIPAHEGTIYALDQLADGTLLTLGSTIRRWNLRQQIMVNEINPADFGISDVSAIGAHPFAGIVAGVNRWGSIALWSTNSGDQLFHQKGDGEKAGRCAWSPGGSRLAVCVDDDVRMLAVHPDGIRTAWKSSHLERVRDVCFTPGGDRIISAGHDGIIRVWGVPDGEEQQRIGAGDTIFSCRVTPDGSSVVVGGYAGTVMVFDLLTGEQVVRFKEHPRWALAVDVTRDGRTAISAGEDGTVRTYDLERLQPGLVLAGHTIDVTSCLVLGDGRSVATAGKDGTVRLWNLEVAERPQGPCHTDRVRGCSIAPSGEWFATSSADETIRSWSLPGGAPRSECTTTSGWWNVVVTQDENVAAVAEGYLDVWSSDLRESVLHLSIPRSRRPTCAVRNGRLAVGGATSVVADLQDGSQMAIESPAGNEATAVAAIGEAGWVTGHSDGRIVRWNPNFTHWVAVGDHGSVVNTCAVDSSLRRIATGGEDWSIRIWPVDELGDPTTLALRIDSQQKQRVKALMMGFMGWSSGEMTGVTTCRFLDDRHLVSGAADGSVRLWDTSRRAQVAALVLGQPILSLDATANGTIVAGDAAGGVHVLEITW